jgi:superoxide dismutase, Fe-Mn family
MSFNRRDMLRAGLGLASAALADKFMVAEAAAQQAPTGPITLPKLPYAFDALEPHIDAKTMEIHHDKHHQAYVDNYNKAIAGHPRLQQMRPVAVLQSADKLPMEIRAAVVNNGGGHVNHSLFWQMMAPKAGGEPKGDVAAAIAKSFGDFEKFKATFADTALKRFGSGWVWLTADKSGQLGVDSVANQDTPLSSTPSTGKHPILGIDVWEHAYYLKYQNRRADYITAWWNVVNWDFVNQLYEQAKKA